MQSGNGWIEFNGRARPPSQAGVRSGPLRIEAKAQRIAVVVADCPLRLPGRKRPERYQLGDECRRRLVCARPSDVDFRPYGEAVQQIFAPVKRQPLLAGRLNHEHRLAGADVLADLGGDHTDNAVGGLVEPPTSTASSIPAALTCASAMARSSLVGPNAPAIESRVAESRARLALAEGGTAGQRRRNLSEKPGFRGVEGCPPLQT
jgi:hypothetical protein